MGVSKAVRHRAYVTIRCDQRHIPASVPVNYTGPTLSAVRWFPVVVSIFTLVVKAEILYKILSITLLYKPSFLILFL